jgi:hypothetical protein
MKKVICLVTVLMMLAPVIGFAREAAPFKFSVVTPLQVPDKATVHGVDFGLLTTTSDNVDGLQLALIYGRIQKKAMGVQMAIVSSSEDFDGAKWGVVALSKNVRGYNSAFVCVARDLIGYQTGIYAQSRKITGVQAGFINVADDVSGLQFGLVNYTGTMDGVQVGLANIIRKSSLPFMVLVNAKFK